MNANSPQKTPAIKQWLAEATAMLSDAGIKSARLDSELILAHTLNRPRTFLHAHPGEPLTDRQNEIASARLELRQDHVPVAYIVGHKHFFGRSFYITTATLVPRPESEDMISLLLMLMGNNLTLLPDTSTKRLVDVGTGSGNLGITAKLEMPELDVTLVDESKHALEVAKKNADALKADVRIVQSNLLDNYPFKADYVLANLPYVDRTWERSPELNHEPPSALFADQGGLALIYRLLEQARYKLQNHGILIIEADPTQHKSIIEKAQTNRLSLINTLNYQLAFSLD